MAVNDSIDRINIGGDERMIKPGAENVRVSNVPIGGESWAPGNVQTALENLRNYVNDNATQIAGLSGKTDLVFGSLNNGIFYDINGNEAVRSATLLYIDRSTGIIYRWGTNSFVVVSKEPMDSTPTSGSQKPITSGGVYNALTAGNIRVAEIKTGRGIPNPISSLDPSAPVSMIAEKWPVSDVQAGLDDLVKKVYGAIGQESSGSGSSATTSTTISAKETVTDGGEMNSQVTINPDGTIVRSATQQSDVTINLPSSSGTLALQSEVGSKQDALVSGQNIKTVNGNSLLGAGNLELGELFVVRMTRNNSNSVYTADKSVSEIYAASYTNGKPVIAVMRDINNPVFILTDCDPDGDSYVFSSIKSNSVTTLRWQRTDDYTYELETIVLQPHLVSGTNIKTINSTSLLGSGNVSVNGVTNVSAPATADGTWQITLTNGDTITIDLNHVHPQYLKYELVQSLPASPDSGTLYLIAAE